MPVSCPRGRGYWGFSQQGETALTVPGGGWALGTLIDSSLGINAKTRQSVFKGAALGHTSFRN